MQLIGRDYEDRIQTLFRSSPRYLNPTLFTPQTDPFQSFFAVLALTADLATGGMGGGLAVRAGVIAARGAQVGHAGAAINAAAHVVLMKGDGGGNNWERFLDDAYECERFEKMPGGDNQHFNDMFESIMDELGIKSRDDARWETAHRAVSGKGISERGPLKAAIEAALGQ